MAKYYAPKNFNFWYFFGVLSLVVLVNQLLTGIWLTMSYEPSAEGAFASVEYIMRDVELWLVDSLYAFNRGFRVSLPWFTCICFAAYSMVPIRRRGNWCGFLA